MFEQLFEPYKEVFRSEQALKVGTLAQRLSDWLTAQKARIGTGLEEFKKLVAKPAVERARDVVREALTEGERIEEAYGVPFRRALERLSRDLEEAQRDLQYRFGARGMVGSGPWVRAREKLAEKFVESLADQLYRYQRGLSEWARTRVEPSLRNLALGIERGGLSLSGYLPSLLGYRSQLYSVIPGAVERAYGLVSDLLKRTQAAKQYEDLARLATAETLYGMYGTPSVLSTLGTLYELAGIPRRIEEANVEAALQDLLYRIGLMSRIAGGFGQPRVSERVETDSWLTPLLGGVQTGIMSFLLERM